MQGLSTGPGTPTNTSVNGSLRETAGPLTWQPNLRLGLRPGPGRLLLELAGEGAFLSQGSRVCATIGRIIQGVPQPVMSSVSLTREPQLVATVQGNWACHLGRWQVTSSYSDESGVPGPSVGRLGSGWCEGGLS